MYVHTVQVKKGKVSKAERTLLRLRGSNYPALEEVKEIVRCFTRDEKDQLGLDQDQSNVKFLEKLKHLALDANVRKPTLLLATMFVFQVSKKHSKDQTQVQNELTLLSRSCLGPKPSPITALRFSTVPSSLPSTAMPSPACSTPP